MAWTDEMVEQLKELWSQGVTTGEIGKRLGISKNSIVGKVHRLGLEGRPSPIKKTGEENTPRTTKKSPKKSDKKTEVSSTKTEAPKEAKNTKAPKPEKTKTVEKAKPEDKKAAPVAPVKSEPVKTSAQIEEDDIKLIKSLDVKVDRDYQKENISLTELDNHTCRWPLGDPKDPDFHFCGRKVKTGQTYCEEHSAVAYVKPVRR